MKVYILIMIVGSSGGGSGVEFNSLQQCEIAKRWFNNQKQYYRSECFVK